MISVITPVYKESPELIGATIEHLAGFGRVSEIILVTTKNDPLASDIHNLISTRFAGNTMLIPSVTDTPGRAMQMNQGARIAKSENLLFFHADTRLPTGADELILTSLNTSGWGRFNVRLDDQRLVFKILSWFINKRSGLTHICTGDQALFMKREFFDLVGGFPEQELMEDIEFSIRAKKSALPAVIKNAVETSARRWQQAGIVRTVLLMWRLRALYWFGVPASRLAKLYRQVR